MISRYLQRMNETKKPWYKLIKSTIKVKEIDLKMKNATSL